MNRLQKVKALIKTPAVDDDPFIVRKANLLNSLLWIMLLFSLIYSPIAFFITELYQYSLFLNSLLLISTIIAFFVFHRRALLHATILLLFSIWLYISFTIIFFGGITSPATISFVFLILAGGLLLDERGLIVTTILGITSCTVVWLLEIYGRLPTSISITGNHYWAAIIIVIIVSAGLLYLGIRSLNTAVALVYRTKKELTELIAARTRDLTIANENLRAEIVNREQVESAYQESEARFRLLFNRSPDAMFLIDPHHPNIPWMIVECNEAACKMNGYTRDELIGNPIFMLDANPDPVAIANTSIALFRDKTILFEGNHLHKDGHVFPIEVALTVITINGKEYLLGQDRDITRRREAEQALKRVHKELEERVAARTADLVTANKALQIEIKERQKVEQARQQLIEELEAKNRELEQFSYTVSHDLKSPLITIRGFLDFIEADLSANKTDRALKDVRRIASATDKMQAMLDNLLELSRVGRISHPPTAVSLNQLISEAIERLNGSIRENNVTIHTPATAPDILADASRLVEVFQNLIGNAIKFMNNQSDPTIHISIAEETENNVTCAIQDNGIGISPEGQQRVFDLFERLNDDVEGTGIGLALVKRIVEVHNGRVWVESEGIGHGSTFFITLPKPKAD